MNPLRAYDYFKLHPKLLWTSLAILTAILAALVIRIRYSEDIGDFLPLGTSDREAMSVYQNISGANRMYILFSNPDDADYTVEAMDSFVCSVKQRDSLGWCGDLTAQFDLGMIRNVSSFVCDNIPYFLTDSDYSRIDSLLSIPGYIEKQLAEDRQMLMFPSGGLAASNIGRDPLALFSPVLSRLNRSVSQMKFEMYDGYIFTPDMSRAIAMMSSPFGNSETEHNSELVDLLNSEIGRMEQMFPGVSAHIVGGPEIAVGNSRRIKADSITAVSISAALIILLLLLSFQSFRNILLIFISIGWGWLFALGTMSILSGTVSIIVIGISSVILGIAVNYPLHLIAHTFHEPDIRSAIKEITVPLVVGNITTVGAFLALVPLKSVALRDLGLFASLLLVGTIVFVLLCLPHLIRVRGLKERRIRILDTLSRVSPERSKVFVVALTLVTAVLAFFSAGVEFDTDMADINYMTSAQKEDMRYFQSLLADDASAGTASLYVLSKGKSYDDAVSASSLQKAVIDSLERGGVIAGHSAVSNFLVSEDEQRHRLGLWQDFVTRYENVFSTLLRSTASDLGFSDDAFTGFFDTISADREWETRDFNYFAPLTESVFSGNFTALDETGISYMVDILDVPQGKMEEVKGCFDNCFDVAGMNSALTGKLTENFNYIGWACSLIVFLFLWFSFGRIELAVISFLPMAVSWLWILGIMAVLGIKFNIVNVILATFIFGQGDDYTIFMTEGCQYEYAHGHPILSSYKKSILQSALIMFVGIGTLIVAKHPAMRSLAQVTIIGMFSVVLMAYVIPPFFFRWLTLSGGKVRRHPLTLSHILHADGTDLPSQVLGRYIYKGKEIYSTARRNLASASVSEYCLTTDAGECVQNVDHGYGELSILLALKNPDKKIKAIMDDDERTVVARIAASDFVENIEFITGDAKICS